MTDTNGVEARDSMEKQFTIDNKLASQFEGSKTDFYTTNFTRFMCHHYRASATSERLFNYGLTNLPTFHSPNESLQFGWGEDTLAQNPGVHLYGYEHIMLSAAMADSIPETYVAAVLSCIGDRYVEGDRTKPRLQSFKNLVSCWNGLLATSELSQVIDDRTRLNPFADYSGHGSKGDASQLVPPLAFATALHAVGELMNGKRETATIVGGDLLGWFAGSAEWLFGLNTHVSDSSGRLLYEAHSGHKSTLKLIFVPQVGPSAVDSCYKTYGIDCLPVIGTVYPPTPFSGALIPFSGRTTWEALLPSVFGRHFHQLAHQETRYLGNALGGIARILEEFAMNEETPEDVISSQNRNNPASYGHGFIQTLATWFPELRHLQGRMERAQKLSVSEASAKCVESADHLEALCGCDICYKDPNAHRLSRNEFCLPTMMETIISLTLALSRVVVISKLYPSRAGILCIYHSQVAVRLKVKSLPPALDQTKYVRMKMLFNNEWNANYGRRLRNIAALFSGVWPTEDLPENLVALSHQGICAYVMKLQQRALGTPMAVSGSGATTPLRQYTSSNSGPANAKTLAKNLARVKLEYDPAEANTIRVTHGKIAWKQTTFSRACLGEHVTAPVTLWDGWEEFKCPHLETSLWCK